MNPSAQTAPQRAETLQEETPLSRIVAATPQRDLLSIPERDREALWKYAQLAVRGGFAGQHKSAESAYCAILYGLEIGLTINQSLQNIYIVKGRASCETEAKAALVTQRGYRPPKTWLENEGTSEKAVAWCVCERDGESTKRSFSFAEAKAAGLTGKDVWLAYWRDMLRWRAMDRAIDEAFPDIVKGLASAEVMRDVSRDAIVQDLHEVDADELVAALETSTGEEEKPKRRRGRPRKEPAEEPMDKPEPLPERQHAPDPTTEPDHLPGDEPESDVDPEWLWEAWRRASEKLGPNEIRQIKDEVTGGKEIFCSQMSAEKIEEAIRLAKAAQ